VSYPEPPWHLQGELIIVPALVKPRGLGGVLLADYRSGTLSYHELIVFSHGTPRGMVVSHIYVDSEQSLHGGREVWGLPKELATFEFAARMMVVRQAGNLLLSASVRRRRGFLPLLIPAPITSPAGDTIGHAWIKAAPALVRLHVPEISPFAHLGLHGTHVGLAGDELKLTMPAPLRRSAGTRARRTAS
jgi:acetoacetate decarboxylase